MARRVSQKTTITLDTDTMDYLDAIAETFEDSVSRGELVDMMAAYIASQELEDEVFGSEEDEEEADEDEGEDEKEAD